jgi:hypothetical protein
MENNITIDDIYVLSTDLVVKNMQGELINIRGLAWNQNG